MSSLRCLAASSIGRIVLALTVTASLSACVTRPKPEYNYAGAPDDPVFQLESDFGVDTNFTVQVNPDPGANLCKARQRVAYYQSMDSYYRDSSLKGPWRMVVPAGQPVVISSGWYKYGTTSFGPSGKSRTTNPGTGCLAQNKLVVAEKGRQYRAYLRKTESGSCELQITAADGSAAETSDYPACKAR